MADIENIEKALLRAQAYLAALRGAQADLEQVNKQASEANVEAKRIYEDCIRHAQEQVARVEAKVQGTRKELEEFEAKAREELGIVVDLDPKPSGGHVRL